MRQVPILLYYSPSHTMPRVRRNRLTTAAHAPSQDRLRAQYDAALSRFQKNYNPRNQVYSRSTSGVDRHRGLPYPSSEEVFLRCNDAGVEDDGFEDLGLSDSIAAFQVSGHTGDKGQCTEPVHRKDTARKWIMYWACADPVHSKYIQNFPCNFPCNSPAQEMAGTFAVSQAM